MQQDNTYEGVLMVRGKGTGFVSLPDFNEDIVINRDNLGQALDGDIVALKLYPLAKDGDRREGKVVTVKKRNVTELIGSIHESAGKFFFRPDNKRIHVKPEVIDATSSDTTQKVVTEIERWPEGADAPYVRITDHLGPLGTHETEMQAIIRGGGFASDFPDAVQDAAQELYERRDEIFRAAAADPERRDMRDVETFTIDPADAKDFDDALSFRRLNDTQVEIGIHIADVSHYAEPGSPLDEEAKERGTSVYLVDRVIPMLPEILSNDLCSLRPKEDRLAFSAVFTLDSEGTVQDEWYGQTVIHSNTRYSYEDAQKTLDTGEGAHHVALSDMMEIARALRRKRYKAGAIAFEQPEVQFELDSNGTPINAYTKERTETMMMVEDFMLLANESVATHIHNLGEKRNQDTAFIYRIHDVPNPDKIEELGMFVRALGYSFTSENGIVTAKELNSLMEEVEGTPEEHLIKTATIRSMAKAVYSTKNIGHFGLAFTYYTHFTSPIRRYPDLLAHRLLRRHIDGKHIGPKELASFEHISTQASEREMEAVSAERDSIKFKQVEYMQNKVGEAFPGIITGVTDWGIYVQEQTALAEGMIHISKLPDDYYVHEKAKYRIVGQNKGREFQLGDEIQVRLTRVDTDERQLDFVLADPPTADTAS
jgi:ribonuclease R